MAESEPKSRQCISEPVFFETRPERWEEGGRKDGAPVVMKLFSPLTPCDCKQRILIPCDTAFHDSSDFLLFGEESFLFCSDRYSLSFKTDIRVPTNLHPPFLSTLKYVHCFIVHKILLYSFHTLCSLLPCSGRVAFPYFQDKEMRLRIVKR